MQRVMGHGCSALLRAKNNKEDSCELVLAYNSPANDITKWESNEFNWVTKEKGIQHIDFCWNFVVFGSP